MLKNLARGLFGRVLGYAGFGLGFWLLFQGFQRPNAGIALVGGVMLLGSMYLMAAARRPVSASGTPGPTGQEEDGPGDSLDGSGQGGKLPP